MSTEDEPTFGEVFDAVTPPLAPGASKADLLAALRSATRTGGFVPGRTAPDISMGPVVTDLSGSGVRPEIMKALAAGAGSMEDVQAALTPGQQRRLEPPADPFSAGAPAAAALHEMFTDLLGAGFTEEQATSILGKMLAAYGAMDRDGGDER